MNWKVFWGYMSAWVMVYFSIWKGIKVSGKLAYFTVLGPYVILLLLIWKLFSLEGSADGLKYLFIPDFTKLFNMKAWFDAISQNFFTSNLGTGTILVFATFRRKDFKVWTSTIM